MAQTPIIRFLPETIEPFVFQVGGLGIEADYVTVLAVLVLLRFTHHFIRTPGGSGIDEVTIAAFMAMAMPAHLFPIYAVLQRIFHLFMPATLGACMLIAELKAADRERKNRKCVTAPSLLFA